MMRKGYAVLLICAVMTLLVVSSAGAQTVLYGTDRTSTLYTIDTATGAATPIGPLGFGQATGLEVDPATGTMYATPGGGGSNPQPISGCLYSVDKDTGAATQVGCDPVQGGLDPFPGFSFDAGGTLYATRLAWNAAPADGGIYLSTIDTATGNFTDIGLVDGYGWCQGNGISFAGGGLYEWDACDGFSTLSLADGSKTVLGGSFIGFPPFPDEVVVPAMDTDPATGVLYAVVVALGNDPPPVGWYLATVNTATGDATYVATLPDQMQTIAFGAAAAEVLTMTEWGMVIFMSLAAMGSVLYLRRKRRASA